MNAYAESPMNAIASAGMGWKSADQARAAAAKTLCHACRHFEMRTIKAVESDSFGHLWPYCNHPVLPGEGGQPTQSTATCDNWERRP